MEWIAVTECTPSENHIIIAAWYNHQTGKQAVYESEYQDGQWTCEIYTAEAEWEVTHWQHFPDAPSIDDALSVRWRKNRELLGMAD